MSYLIKPVNNITGATAPAIISFCEKKEDAIIDAASKSSLSKYPRWRFNIDVKSIKDKPVRKFKNDEE